MKLTCLDILFLVLSFSLSSAYPLEKRDGTFVVNPLLLNVAFPNVSTAQQGFNVGTKNVATLPDALVEACTQRADALEQAFADCQGANKGTRRCNKVNGSPIDSAAVTNQNDQCLAHRFDAHPDGTFDVQTSIFDIPLPFIVQDGKTFGVGDEIFKNLPDALTGACKWQMTDALAKLNDCKSNPNGDGCKRLNGQPITREDLNKQHSSCFSLAPFLLAQ